MKPPFAYFGGTAEEHALALVQAGVLSIGHDGSIWRHAFLSNGSFRPLPQARRIDTDDGRYRSIRFQHCGRVVTVKAHRLVWIAEHGPIPDGLEVNHKDLDKQNNRLGNLEVLTPSGNMLHSYANGRTKPWADPERPWRGRPRMTSAKQDRMKELRAEGKTLAEIGEEVGCSLSHVSRLLARAK